MTDSEYLFFNFIFVLLRFYLFDLLFFFEFVCLFLACFCYALMAAVAAALMMMPLLLLLIGFHVKHNLNNKSVKLISKLRFFHLYRFGWCFVVVVCFLFCCSGGCVFRSRQSTMNGVVAAVMVIA